MLNGEKKNVSISDAIKMGFIPNARTIKGTKIWYIVLAVIDFFIARSFFGTADKYVDSGYYYWSSDVRSAVSAYRAFGVLFVIFCLVNIGYVAYLFVMGKNGKVCPKCERVCSSAAAVCPTCGIDITHAMNVKEHLANKPVPTSKAPMAETPPAPVPTAPAAENPTAANGENPAGSEKRYCPFCGKALPESSAFCPNCGNKVP